jgi:pSer/pThr/pTyr-binding forkhead associated (FHA) protein
MRFGVFAYGPEVRMRDGRTRKTRGAAGKEGIREFLRSYQARLVVLSGPSAGQQFPLKSDQLTIGRGPGVDVAIRDSTMSRQHASIAFTQEGFRVQDLGSTNGVLLNGSLVQVGEIRNGDRIRIGAHEFQLVIEPVESAPNTYVLNSEM